MSAVEDWKNVKVELLVERDNLLFRLAEARRIIKDSCHQDIGLFTFYLHELVVEYFPDEDQVALFLSDQNIVLQPADKHQTVCLSSYTVVYATDDVGIHHRCLATERMPRCGIPITCGVDGIPHLGRKVGNQC